MLQKRMTFALVSILTIQSLCGLPASRTPTQPPASAVPEGSESVGTINLVNSQVEAGPPNALQSLDGEQDFFNGDGVRVSGGGKGKLLLNDGTQLLLLNETEISGVDVSVSPREADLLLQRQGFVGNVPPGGQTVVRTPTGAVITILGTNFLVVHNVENGVTTAGNFDGSVLYSASGLAQQPLAPGRLVEIEANGNTREDALLFTMDEFERAVDEWGTPSEGLSVLRRESVQVVTVPPFVVVTPITEVPAVGRWSGTWEDLGAVIKGAPAVASWGPNRLDVFARGLDDALWHNAWNGSAWSGWGTLGGVITSSPAAVSWGHDRIDVFALGLNGHIWQISWIGASGWTDWSDQGGLLDPDGDNVIQGDFAVTARGPNQLDIFATDVNEQLWHRSGTTFSWSSWEYIGYSASSPSATARDVDLLEVVTAGPDNEVYLYSWNGGWSDPFILGEIDFASPGITSWRADRLDVIVPSDETDLMHGYWNGSTWSDWVEIGNQAFSAPAVVSWGPERIDVFVTGGSSQVIHYWYAR